MDKVNSHKSQLNMFNENREMMNFLDKYFDIFKIDVDFYPHNLEQIKDL